MELFAFQALCFCIFLNSCLKVGNCDGCLKNFKCDAADLMIFYSVLNFFYYFWCLGCYSLCCLFDCFNGFSAAGVFSIFSTVDFTVALALVVALFRLLVLLFLLFSIMEHSLPHISLTERICRNMYLFTVA